MHIASVLLSITNKFRKHAHTYACTYMEGRGGRKWQRGLLLLPFEEIVAIYRPGVWPSPDVSSGSTLTLDFLVFKSVKNQIMLFEVLVYARHGGAHER